MKRKICIITGSRAEYGLLHPLLLRIKFDKRYILQLVVTGAHLSVLYGNTYKEILNDGFKISAKVPLNHKEGTTLEVTTNTGEAVKGFGKAIGILKPDLIILLGDRFEMMAAAIAAHLMSIPIAHIQGGEITTGSLDDAMRHAITKLSVLHFTANRIYQNRVIQMGEDPKRVFNVGSLGVENCHSIRFLRKAELEEKLSIKLSNQVAVITLHPATKEKISTEKQVRSLFDAMDRFPGLQYIITYPNADSGGSKIIDAINKFGTPRKNVHIYKSLGVVNYLSLLKFTDVVIGNSSSGIIEVPSFGIPTVNIGERQKSRMAAKSVIHTKANEDSIYRAIQKALKPSFRLSCKKVFNPYGDGKASIKIMSVLHKLKKFSNIEKIFHDL